MSMYTQTDHYCFYWHAWNSKEQIEQRSGGIHHVMESKKAQSHVLSQAYGDGIGQIREENLGHEV